MNLNLERIPALHNLVGRRGESGSGGRQLLCVCTTPRRTGDRRGRSIASCGPKGQPGHREVDRAEPGPDARGRLSRGPGIAGDRDRDQSGNRGGRVGSGATGEQRQLSSSYPHSLGKSMSRDDLSVLQQALNNWPEPYTRPTGSVVSDACRRTLDAMPHLGTEAAGWRDLAGLIRQVLIIAKVTYAGNPALAVPAVTPWPTSSDWDTMHCAVGQIVGQRRTVRALDWAPHGSEEDKGPAAELALEQVRATYLDANPVYADLVVADPFWTSAHRFDHYRGEPQRQAARAAVLNDGGSLIVALPTGRGKTAVAWSKALLSDRGVTIVVVPTVVLALDMERRTSEEAQLRGENLSPLGRFAYVGSLAPDVKKQLRDAVREGSQRLLYTSPEALVTGLAPALLACADAGMLQQIVIDEAHLVDQWGTDFRPEFQTMPGLIREAYGRAPEAKKPSVLMLSATLAQRPIDLLTRLFAMGDDPVDVVWGSEIRTEPAYFLNSHLDEATRVADVLEAVSCLPRPLILYTTTVADAEDWVTRLHDAGLARVECVTGQVEG